MTTVESVTASLRDLGHSDLAERIEAASAKPMPGAKIRRLVESLTDLPPVVGPKWKSQNSTGVAWWHWKTKDERELGLFVTSRDNGFQVRLTLADDLFEDGSKMLDVLHKWASSESELKHIVRKIPGLLKTHRVST